ncbi:hypothetical protein KO481_32055 [Nocardia sp. NEAU-G5]|uniref:DUF5666 domain-containing protein n=1 Tax=Nocardia albiluteola TaxID=2842303 RepID=A0ABS6B748_9NOCA|nr:DUF5666 domain-containing protein [Nocardia albiluteola]MBU3066138.1 hypothetical protein [Nocardia albiluteola]
MTNPSDPWGQRPDSPETPTEHIGGRGAAEGAQAGEHSEAPPPPPAEFYPYNEPVPGPNATRQLPPYQSQWGVYDTPGAYDTQWGGPPETQYAQGGSAGPTEYHPTVQYGPGDGPTAEYGPDDVPTEYVPGAVPVYVPGAGPAGPRGRNRAGTWVLLSLGIFGVVVLGAAALGFFLAGHDSSSSSAPDALTTSRPTAQFPLFPQTSGGVAPSRPGLPGSDNLGATMGTVATNDGSTLTIDSLSGSTITVHTDAKTQVITLGSGTLADLHAGDMVVVQGNKNPDGTILAKMIIGTVVPASTTQVPYPTR